MEELPQKEHSPRGDSTSTKGEELGTLASWKIYKELRITSASCQDPYRVSNNPLLYR